MEIYFIASGTGNIIELKVFLSPFKRAMAYDFFI